MSETAKKPDIDLSMADDLAFEDDLTQKEKVLQFMKDNGAVTNRAIYTRLLVNGPRDRISELRQDGHDITDERVQYRGKEFKVYRLDEGEEDEN